MDNIYIIYVDPGDDAPMCAKATAINASDAGDIVVELLGEYCRVEVLEVELAALDNLR